MSSQTVFRLTSRDGFQGLQPFKEPIPAAGRHEVLVRVRSVALNYRDVAIATSTYPLPVRDNVIPCSDMAGEVAEIGDLVTGFTVGDRVLVAVSPSYLYGTVPVDATDTFGGMIDGMLREYITLPAHTVIKLPKSSHSFSQWAAIVGTGTTVWNSFYGSTPLKPGDTVLFLGTGGVSLTGLIFAKAAGTTTIITSSSDEKLAYVKSKFGADHTINYRTHPNWAAEVKRITGGRGVDHVLEVSGEGTIEQSIESLATGGIISVIGFLTHVPQEKMPNLTMLTILKACVLRGILAGSKQQLEDAVRFIGSRELPVPLDKTFPFSRDGIVSALEYIAAGEHMGKVCINLD
ncbi:NAD(P)-binding protein [Pleurostoma richardsiae]|uniref:NAD(P)-binding protein n=1 Tax=Pleurostoma richardsiae TaxID=41990 RepID=A0AA38VIM6_9PEZI|nr:NAD(P)-binding protein [Pleurostoma richardsiae]